MTAVWEESSLAVTGEVLEVDTITWGSDGRKVFSVLLEGTDSRVSHNGHKVGPNHIKVYFYDHWADACSVLSPSDKVTIERFGISPSDSPTSPFSIVATDSSKVDIIRNRHITLTSETTQNFDFRLDTTKRVTDHAARVVKGHNQFTRCGKYYDVVRGSSATVHKNGAFLLELLGKYNCKTVLDVACGTGIYSIFLRYYAFPVTGVDASPTLLSVANEKLALQQATELTSKGGTSRFLKGDMCSFEVLRPDASPDDGWKGYEQFDCALLLDSMQLAPSLQKVQGVLRRIWYHLKLNGILLLDIPNHHVVNATDYTQEHVTFPIDRMGRSLGSATLDEGTLELIVRSYIKDKYRVTEWNGFALQTKPESKVKYYTSFDERFDELIINPVDLEYLFDLEGFDVLALYGTLDGEEYSSRTSTRRFYVLRRRDMEAKPVTVEYDGDEDDGPPSMY